MRKNMSTADRAIRIALAILFAVLFFTHTVTGVLGWILLLVAIIFLLTSFVSFCPLYALFGISTGPKKEAKV